jgi:hypothetical protein
VHLQSCKVQCKTQKSNVRINEQLESGWSIESRLEGVNRRNLKIINLSTHYKPGLALEMNPSPKERGKVENNSTKK